MGRGGQDFTAPRTARPWNPCAAPPSFAPGTAGWALRTTIGFEGLACLGALALLGGILALAQPLPRGVVSGIFAFAGLTLLGTTGLEMRAMAGGFRPFSLHGADAPGRV